MLLNDLFTVFFEYIIPRWAAVLAAVAIAAAQTAFEPVEQY